LIADELRKPLVRVSSGDLGTYAFEADKNLRKILNAAQVWSAIVLIDEADVFLTQRTSSGDDYHRNAIVSMFLTHLEYFKGVLFLTTNRETAELDEAVGSRITMILHYPSLDKNKRANIWQDQMKDEMVPQGPNQKTEMCHRLGERYELNGREIKNLLQTSTKLCQHREQQLSEDVIDKVYSVRYAKKVLDSGTPTMKR
jgi:SpoVK/Ycf46/Vps4 family AAA+-type ATPase